jgi:GIY-YIG catalytic domain
MTCGIYALRFTGTDKVYIGQSRNIESRYNSHLNGLMGKGKASIQMREAYRLYGCPALEILLECTIEELNECENEAIEIFDSFHNGFNTLPTAETGVIRDPNLVGELVGTSVYSNDQILEAARLMGDPTITIADIVERTKVKRCTLDKISEGVQHTWLKDDNIEVWEALQKARKARLTISWSNHGDKVRDKVNAKALGISYPPLVSPTGEVVRDIANMTEFCRVNGLQTSNIGKVMRGERSHTKGWKLYSEGI